MPYPGTIGKPARKGKPSLNRVILAASALKPRSVDRGHLIPASYGGTAGAENIVTQELRYNQTHFRDILEYKLNDMLDPSRGKCNWACVVVVPHYTPGWKPVPLAFEISIVHKFESFEHFTDQQPGIMGNLNFDLEPWRSMKKGVTPLNYEVLHAGL